MLLGRIQPSTGFANSGGLKPEPAWQPAQGAWTSCPTRIVLFRPKTPPLARWRSTGVSRLSDFHNNLYLNVARGGVINEQALADAIEAGEIAGAALDVFELEPLPAESPLLKMENVMLAPHNSNSSPAAWERVHWNTIRNLLEGLGVEHELDHR